MINKLLKLSDKLEVMKFEAEADKIDKLVISTVKFAKLAVDNAYTRPLTWNEWYTKWRSDSKTGSEAEAALRTWLYSFWEAGNAPPSDVKSIKDIPARTSPTGGIK
jgi:hypothetical protein